jgi:hypothetical protein
MATSLLLSVIANRLGPQVSSPTGSLSRKRKVICAGSPGSETSKTATPFGRDEPT